jgi:hypothetical protein
MALRCVSGFTKILIRFRVIRRDIAMGLRAVAWRRLCGSGP